MADNALFNKMLEDAKGKAEFVTLIRMGVRSLTKDGYSPRELGFKAKKKARKTKTAAKDEFADMFTLPDLQIGSVGDGDDSETLVYDGEYDSDDD